MASPFKTANGALVSTMGCCDAWITNGEYQVLAPFAVIPSFPHDVVLGMYVFSVHSPVIDCAKDQIELTLTDAYEPPDPSSPRLCSAGTTLLERSSAVYIDVRLTSAAVDGEYIIFQNPGLVFQRQLAIPHSAV